MGEDTDRITAEQWKLYEGLGGCIAAARKAAGLSQTQLGTLVGMSQRSISAYEKGAVAIPLHHVLAIEAALRLPRGHLLTAAEIVPVTGDALTAIEADPSLADPIDRAVIVDAYKRFSRRGAKRPARVRKVSGYRDPDPSPSSPPAKRPLVKDSDREALEPYMRRGQERLKRGRRGPEVERDRGENNTNR